MGVGPVVADCGATMGAAGGCGQQCYTVMKTRRRVVYEQQQHTVNRTVYSTVMQDRTINSTRYVRETHNRQVPYTVSRPVRETHYRTVNYTVQRKHWETRPARFPTRSAGRSGKPGPRNSLHGVPHALGNLTREIPYTVCRVVGKTDYARFRTRLSHRWETRSKEIPYTVNRVASGKPAPSRFPTPFAARTGKPVHAKFPTPFIGRTGKRVRAKSPTRFTGRMSRTA